MSRINDELLDVAFTTLLNANCESERLQSLLAEVRRVLTSTGEIIVHALVSDGPAINEHPRLPGPASVLEIVPTLPQVLQDLRAAGFTFLAITTLSQEAVFISHGIALRELKVQAKLA